MTSQNFGLYLGQPGSDDFRPATADEIISIARFALSEKIKRQGHLAQPEDARAFFCLRLGALEHEVFGVAYLDAQHRVIEYCELFRGTLTETSVYPREVVKQALRLNAAAAIAVHNHPSGQPEASRADEYLTGTLKSALTLIGVRLLDHVIVGGGTTMSFAERGML